MQKFVKILRWLLFRIHLNGVMSSARLHAARQAPVLLPCPLCGRADDSARHVLSCSVVQRAFSVVEDALPENVVAPCTWAQLFFQTPVNPETLNFTLALFVAAWAVRSAVQRGVTTPRPHEDIALAALKPWTLSGSSADKRARRAARVKAPEAISADTVRSRTDGGFGPSENAMLGVWGAAWWDVGVNPSEPPSATAAGICPSPSSNNIAEFYGFRAALRRALRRLPPTYRIRVRLPSDCHDDARTLGLPS